jgi:hypothetical protein
MHVAQSDRELLHALMLAVVRARLRAPAARAATISS